VFNAAVWWLGYYFMLGLDVKEARTAAFITIVLLVPVYFCSSALTESLTPKKNERTELHRQAD
jgi:hypothetical protein